MFSNLQVANLQLLESVTIEGIDTNSKWAWLQLGLHHLEQKNFKEAVDTLRSVIRADQNDRFVIRFLTTKSNNSISKFVTAMHGRL